MQCGPGGFGRALQRGPRLDDKLGRPLCRVAPVRESLRRSIERGRAWSTKRRKPEGRPTSAAGHLIATNQHPQVAVLRFRLAAAISAQDGNSQVTYDHN